MTCRDIKERNFVRTLIVVPPRDLDWIPGVFDINESDAFDHSPGIDVKAGDNAFR
jgi:hypothetical protein